MKRFLKPVLKYVVNSKFIFLVISSLSLGQTAAAYPVEESALQWPSLHHWLISIGQAIPTISNTPNGTQSEVHRDTYLLSAPSDIQATRARLKLTEGLLPDAVTSTPNQPSRYQGGGDETCETFSSDSTHLVLDTIRQRLGAKRSKIPQSQINAAAFEIRTNATRGKITLCESVLLDDSEHDYPVYLQAFLIKLGSLKVPKETPQNTGGGISDKPQAIHHNALILVETRW